MGYLFFGFFIYIIIAQDTTTTTYWPIVNYGNKIIERTEIGSNLYIVHCPIDG